MTTKQAVIGNTTVVRTDETVSVYKSTDKGKAILVDQITLPSVGKAKLRMNDIIERVHKDPDAYKAA